MNTSVEGLGMVETTLRHHLETKRLDVVGRNSKGRFPQTQSLSGLNTDVASRGRPCWLTRPAVKDFRQLDANPNHHQDSHEMQKVPATQTHWHDCLSPSAAHRLLIQYPVKNLMRRNHSCDWSKEAESQEHWNGECFSADQWDC